MVRLLRIAVVGVIAASSIFFANTVSTSGASFMKPTVEGINWCHIYPKWCNSN